MKIVLVHDYIKEYGGAERVLEALHEVWPDAPVFTTVYLPEFLGPHRGRFAEWNIKTSFLQYVPFKQKLISPFRLIAPWVFRKFDFSNFDIIIVSSTGAYSKILNTKYLIHNTIQVVYCHTPPRYLYGFATAREWKNNFVFKILGELANHFLRLVDFKSAQNVDYFIANSKNVALRIKKFYRKEAVVIYPPVEIPNSKSQIPNNAQNLKSKNKYFLAGGRIARPKHIDLIIKTFVKLGLPLKVFGREFGEFKIQSSKFKITSKNSKVEFLGEVSDYEKLELMRKAKAYIFASEDEDFGITPVEAQSVGTPVIAYKSGGVVESVLQGRTGIFFDKLSVESLSEAIGRFENMKFGKELIMRHAEKFSKERFKREIKLVITEARKGSRKHRNEIFI